jgi:alanine racemase
VLHARTWAEIDLTALERNLAAVRRAAGDAAVMLVVKADAYGHGAVPVSWHLLKHGVACLAVGDSTEALALRGAGVTAPILILGAIVPGEMEDVVRGGIAVTVHTASRVRELRHEAERRGARVKVHLKVDTGMGRLGCAPERALGIAREILRSRGLVLEGLATHLASPNPAGAVRTERQLTRFARVLADLRREGIDPPWRHALSSGGILSFPGAARGGTSALDLNMIRPGIAIYGIGPGSDADAGGEDSLRPALSWRTQIVYLRDHRAGSRIGYGGTWRAPRPSRIATLPVGYNDGYRFAFSNKAHVLVRGQRAPVVGRVSMDYVTVDVTDIPGVAVGDVATLIGSDGDESIRVEELATWADSIPYEILCGIGRRVVREYVERLPAPLPAETAAAAGVEAEVRAVVA